MTLPSIEHPALALLTDALRATRGPHAPEDIAKILGHALDATGYVLAPACPADDRVVLIARCHEHGLHGERQACFVCGGPVEQVAMVPAGSELQKALLNVVEAAARELDELFDPKCKGPRSKPGDLDEWDLNGRRATGRVSLVLLSLHDYLNDVKREREAACRWHTRQGGGCREPRAPVCGSDVALRKGGRSPLPG